MKFLPSGSLQQKDTSKSTSMVHPKASWAQLVSKMLYETTKDIFSVTPCFPQSVKITILTKNYGKLKDVNV